MAPRSSSLVSAWRRSRVAWWWRNKAVGAQDRLHVGRRQAEDVVGGNAGGDRFLHEGGVVLIDEQDDGAWIAGRDLADAVQRVAVGAGHVHQDDVGEQAATASARNAPGCRRSTVMPGSAARTGQRRRPVRGYRRREGLSNGGTTVMVIRGDASGVPERGAGCRETIRPLPLREGVGGGGAARVGLNVRDRLPTDPSPSPPPSRGGEFIRCGLPTS